MIALNGLPVISIRLVIPWTGAWMADVDLDLTDVPVMPQGACVIVCGTTSLIGTIDPDHSGKYGFKGKARVIGGGAGWKKSVRAQHFTNPAGVFDAAVIAATAGEVFEQALVPVPTRLGTDYVRNAGPAAQVLEGRDWYVSFQGVTIVGPRPTLPMNPATLDVLGWHPDDQIAELAADEPILPGTILGDALFGTATVRDVEQTFDASGSHAIAWCGSSAGSRIAAALSALSRPNAQLLTRVHWYRVAVLGTDGLGLQAIASSSGVPDSIPISMWGGLPGMTAKPTPGAEVGVIFLDGNPANPRVIAYDKTQALELAIDALRVAFGAGTAPVAKAPNVIAWGQTLVTALTAALNAIPTGGAAAASAFAATMQTAQSGLAAAASTKVFTD